MIAYLDNSATTRPCDQAVQAVARAMTDCWGNPSALHNLGIEAQRALHGARLQVAQALGADPDRVFFTAGGTEADNWAIFSAARRMAKRGRHIVTTQIEHHAVLEPMARLEAEGFEITRLAPDARGCIPPETLAAALRKDTVLVSVMMVNNEVGSVMDIAAMVRLTRRLAPNALFHTDCVQAFLKLPFRADRLGADLISVSGHKVHGPKGVGALYVRKGLPLPAFVLGGGQESGMRSGTEAMPAILGFGAACAAAAPTLRQDAAAERALLDQLAGGLAQLPGVVINGTPQAPHILSLAVPGLRSQGLINCLQDMGIYVSAGSACARGHRSHVLEAMGVDPAVIDGSIRVSLSRFTTREEIALFLDALPKAVARLG